LNFRGFGKRACVGIVLANRLARTGGEIPKENPSAGRVQ